MYTYWEEKKIAISDIPTSEIKNELCLREFECLDPTLNPNYRLYSEKKNRKIIIRVGEKKSVENGDIRLTMCL